MDKIKLNTVLALSLLVIHFRAHAQAQGRDELKTQEVTVVKSYKPTLSSVFKIRASPIINDSLLEKKLFVNYNFISAPVISTFVPNKASPLKLQKQESSILYNSYFSGGYGNQSQALIDFSSMLSLDRNQSLGIDFNYFSLGNQKNTLLKSDQNFFIATFLHLYKSNNFRVESDFKFDHNHINFYGLSSDYDWLNINSFRPFLIDPKQNLNYLRIHSNWEFYNTFIKKFLFNTIVTIDSFDTTEHIVSLNSEFRLPVIDFYLELRPSFNLINTKFANPFKDGIPLLNQNGLFNLDLQVVSLGDEINFRFGTKVFYWFGDVGENSKIYFFPKIEFSYEVPSSSFITFLEVEGDFKLNSFSSFSKQNPYVAPSLEINPTNIPYKGRLGVKTSPGSGIEFFLAGIYSTSENFPLFKRLPYVIDNDDVAYKVGNSYEVVYDELEELGIETGILMRFNEHNKFSLKTRYVNSNVNNERSVWNIPALKIDFEANFRFYDKIYFQGHGKYIGQRDSAYYPISLDQESVSVNSETKSLKGFLHLSSRLLYQTNLNWAFFLDVRNNFGSDFSRWANYQSYTRNFMLGLRYKFDINL